MQLLHQRLFYVKLLRQSLKALCSMFDCGERYDYSAICSMFHMFGHYDRARCFMFDSRFYESIVTLDASPLDSAL